MLIGYFNFFGAKRVCVIKNHNYDVVCIPYSTIMHVRDKVREKERRSGYTCRPFIRFGSNELFFCFMYNIIYWLKKSKKFLLRFEPCNLK